MKNESDGVDAVLVDEEAVGSWHASGCGAKIIRGNGEFERFAGERTLPEPMVLFLISFGSYNTCIISSIFIS